MSQVTDKDETAEDIDAELAAAFDNMGDVPPPGDDDAPEGANGKTNPYSRTEAKLRASANEAYKKREEMYHERLKELRGKLDAKVQAKLDEMVLAGKVSGGAVQNAAAAQAAIKRQIQEHETKMRELNDRLAKLAELAPAVAETETADATA